MKNFRVDHYMEGGGGGVGGRGGGRRGGGEEEKDNSKWNEADDVDAGRRGDGGRRRCSMV